MPRTFHELRHTNGNNIEAMVMYGLTDKQPDELTSLNRSWSRRVLFLQRLAKMLLIS